MGQEVVPVHKVIELPVGDLVPHKREGFGGGWPREDWHLLFELRKISWIDFS